MKGLIIGSPWIEKILAKRKTWEIRSSRTRFREEIALIRSGSGLVLGTCELVDVIGPLTLKELQRNAKKAGAKRSDITSRPYKKTYAWVLKNVKKYERPRRYKHPQGAVIWVKLS